MFTTPNEVDMYNPSEKQVLVAIMNNLRDFKTAQTKRWYRIPVKSAPKKVKAHFLAFYQTKAFGGEKWAVNYFAEIINYRVVKRIELLPDETLHPMANEDYYKLTIGELQCLSHPIISKRWRRIVFIPTTMEKFQKAEEINDLYNESPLEDKVWHEFKEEGIEAERQLFVGDKKINYCLDFAIFCKNGQLDVECDGDTYHTQRDFVVKDNLRNNYLTSQGWSVLRFGSKEINENISYCIETVRNTANRYGRIIVPDTIIARTFETKNPGGYYQLNLF